MSHRVIADHLRASSFLIADGVLPSKEGRGYVLRRIMRRAMRHAQMLGCKDPLMWRLVPALVQQMGAAYPELIRAQPLITETLRLEETNFRQTLERGLGLLDDMAAGPGLTDDGRLSGTVAFTLYDTYGFPLDLTQDILRGRGIAVDTDGFEAEMEAGPRPLARLLGRLRRGRDRGDVVRACATRSAPTEFLGYDTETAEGVILAIMRGDERVDEASAGDEVGIVVNQTPFYAESGGQVGDTGAIFSAQRRRAGGARHAQEGRRAAPASRHDAARHAARSATRSNCGSMAAGAGSCAPTIRSRTCCTRRCGTGSASM